MKTSESLLKQAADTVDIVNGMLKENPRTEMLLRLTTQMAANATRMQIAAGLFAIAEAMEAGAPTPTPTHAPKPVGFVPPQKAKRG